MAVDGRPAGAGLARDGRPRGGRADRHGFGSHLIDMGLLGTGNVERRYAPAGVEVELRVALAELGT